MFRLVDWESVASKYDAIRRLTGLEEAQQVAGNTELVHVQPSIPRHVRQVPHVRQNL